MGSLSLCGQSVANLGEQDCDKSRGILKKLFIFNGTLDSSDLADEATLFAALVANSKLTKTDADKVFVINESQDIADASEANKEGTLGLGFKTILLEGKPAYNIKLFAGSDLLKRLRTYNNKTIRFLEYDSNSTLWGYKTGTTVRGFQGRLFFSGNKGATGQNVEEGVVNMYLSVISTSEYLDNAQWADLAGHNIEDIKGLIDAPLAWVSKVSNVNKYSLNIAGSNMITPFNVLEEYGTEIAALTFTAKSGAGVPALALTITSVAYDSTNKLLTVTYDSTLYTAAVGNITLIPPTPAVLDAADVTNLEILPVTHVK